MTLHRLTRDEINAIVRRCHTAIKSIAAQPPVIQRGFPKGWVVGEVVRDVQEAYGYQKPERRYAPTPADLDDMLPVLAAIVKHKKHSKYGERDYKIIVGRAFNQPYHRISDRLGTSASDRSLARWQDRACEEIITTRLTTVTVTNSIK